MNAGCRAPAQPARNNETPDRGGVFVAGSVAWGIVVNGFRPALWDYVGSAVALLGAAIIIFAPPAADASD